MSEVDEYLDFLSQWRSKQEFMNYFNLASLKAFFVLKWLEKGNYIESCSVIGVNPGKRNRTYLYRKK